MHTYSTLKNSDFTIIEVLIERLFLVEKELETIIQKVENCPADFPHYQTLIQQQSVLIDQRESLCAGIKILLYPSSFFPSLSGSLNLE